MSGEDWTPGPWVYKASDGNENFFIGNDACNCAFVGGYQDHPQVLADARLISCAPELYEALKDLAHSVAYSDDEEQMLSANRAVAILAKCRGETP